MGITSTGLSIFQKRMAFRINFNANGVNVVSWGFLSSKKPKLMKKWQANLHKIHGLHCKKTPSEDRKGRFCLSNLSRCSACPAGLRYNGAGVLLSHLRKNPSFLLCGGSAPSVLQCFRLRGGPRLQDRPAPLPLRMNGRRTGRVSISGSDQRT